MILLNKNKTCNGDSFPFTLLKNDISCHFGIKSYSKTSPKLLSVIIIFLVITSILSLTFKNTSQNNLTCINKNKEMKNVNKKFLSNDFNQNNSIQGSTNLRFKVSHPPWTTWLDADDFYTYRIGISQLISYLGWISQFGVSSRNDVIDYDRINNTVEEVIKIFTTVIIQVLR